MLIGSPLHAPPGPRSVPAASPNIVVSPSTTSTVEALTSCTRAMPAHPPTPLSCRPPTTTTTPSQLPLPLPPRPIRLHPLHHPPHPPQRLLTVQPLLPLIKLLKPRRPLPQLHPPQLTPHKNM